MAEDKIPVLTEVYKPKAGKQTKSTTSDTLDVTPDLVAKVIAQVKPRLESEITDFVLEELRAELKKAHSDVISSTQDFVDKTKANLKTELPSMYQESVKLSQIDIDNLKQTTLNDTSLAVRKEMMDFQAKLREEFRLEKDRMLSAATTEAKAIFAAQMTEGQEALKQNIERVVNQAVPEMESRVRKQLTADLQQLLLKVKFVLPEKRLIRLG
ncbi:MAG: hypothetical protein ACI8PW_000478 [Methylophilaceae bacterium]